VPRRESSKAFSSTPGAVKGGPQGRPAGTEAKRRPLTAPVSCSSTMDQARPAGWGLPAPLRTTHHEYGSNETISRDAKDVTFAKDATASPWRPGPELCCTQIAFYV
jgi:hypothetical protein